MAEDTPKDKSVAASFFRSGFVAIIGRPNVGKSTLLNQLVGEKVAIVSPKPQTTRNRLTGIKTSTSAQMVFLDTPGIHQAHSLMNRRMVEVALNTLHEVNCILWLLDARGGIGPEDARIAEALSGVRCPMLMLINKIDLVSKGKLLPLIRRCSELLPGQEILPVSALTGDNLELLIELITKRLPEGTKIFPDDEFTDQSERFLASEIIREKIFLLTHEEIPYGVAVTIDEFADKQESQLTVIKATVHTERDSHKGILIGKRGTMLKEIGTRAREELQTCLGRRVFLELFVRVDSRWTQSPHALMEMGL